MQKWEYLHVIAWDLGKWRYVPRFVNRKEVPNWEKGTDIFEFANQLGEQGWELVSGTDFIHLVFKRPNPNTRSPVDEHQLDCER